MSLFLVCSVFFFFLNGGGGGGGVKGGGGGIPTALSFHASFHNLDEEMSRTHSGSFRPMIKKKLK